MTTLLGKLGSNSLFNPTLKCQCKGCCKAFHISHFMTSACRTLRHDVYQVVTAGCALFHSFCRGPLENRVRIVTISFCTTTSL